MFPHKTRNQNEVAELIAPSKPGRDVMRLIKHLTILPFLGLIILGSIKHAGSREEGYANQLSPRISANQLSTVISDPPLRQGKISILSFDAQSLPGEIRYQGM